MPYSSLCPAHPAASRSADTLVSVHEVFKHSLCHKYFVGPIISSRVHEISILEAELVFLSKVMHVIRGA
jgi:hypothetical protein